MSKITFMGAGSWVFAKNILGDALCAPALKASHIALYDIDGRRLKESLRMMETLNDNINQGRARITAHLGPSGRKAALRGAHYVVNAVNVGGYPSMLIDFEVPKKHGLRQTIGDTLGIGGIFRGLRTIPVVLDFARDMESVCPDAWLLNYTNPMAMVTGALQRGCGVKTVGLCHSVQVCASMLLDNLGMAGKVKKLRWNIAGINHQAWLLEIRDEKKDLNPEIRRRGRALVRKARRKGAVKNHDMVRLEIMNRFGYYLTESSTHSAEYMPWFIKSSRPGLIEEFSIPLDAYPAYFVKQMESWKTMAKDLVDNVGLSHERTYEYGSYIMEAMETGVPCHVWGNVLNTGLITNLPAEAVVEVPCLVNCNGVQGCYVGALPQQCAAINRTNINVHLLTIAAALTRKRDYIYQAAYLDPHTAAELSLDEIRAMCDEMIAAHGRTLPRYR